MVLSHCVLASSLQKSCFHPMVAWVQVSDTAAEISCEIRMWLLFTGAEERIPRTPIANLGCGIFSWVEPTNVEPTLSKKYSWWYLRNCHIPQNTQWGFVNVPHMHRTRTKPLPLPLWDLRQGLLLKMPATAGASCPFTHPPSCRPTYEVLHGMDHMILSSQPCIKKVLPWSFVFFWVFMFCFLEFYYFNNMLCYGGFVVYIYTLISPEVCPCGTYAGGGVNSIVRGISPWHTHRWA